MARSTGTLEQQRERLKKRGHRKVRSISGDAALPDFERQLKQRVFVYLKAGGFSNTYCADALGISTTTVDSWLADEELKLKAEIAKVSADYIEAGVTMIQSYILEIVESLMDIFRTTEDEKLAKEIGFEMLSLVGIVKANKSESVSTRTIKQQHEVDVIDKTGLVAIAKNAPPEVQAAMARQVEELVAIAQEHAENELG